MISRIRNIRWLLARMHTVHCGYTVADSCAKKECIRSLLSLFGDLFSLGHLATHKWIDRRLYGHRSIYGILELHND